MQELAYRKIAKELSWVTDKSPEKGIGLFKCGQSGGVCDVWTCTIVQKTPNGCVGGFHELGHTHVHKGVV